MFTEDITEVDIAGFVRQILSGKNNRSSFDLFSCCFLRVGILTLIEHCSFGLEARKHCMS